MPLILLSVSAAAAGFIHFGELVSAHGKALESHFDLAFSAAPVALGAAGILLAIWMYAKAGDRPAKLAASLGSIYKSAYHKFYIDELYLFITKKVLFNIIGRAAAWFDRNIVDGLVNLTGNTTVFVSDGIKKFQSGKVQHYALFFLGGVILLAVLFIYVFKPVYF